MLKSLNELYSAGSEPIVVAFGNFTYSNKDFGSEFSVFLEEQLGMAMASCAQYELFAQDKLEEILEAQEMSLSDLFLEEDSIKIGHLKNIKAILSGRFFENDTSVNVYINLVNIETGVYYKIISLNIPRKLIPGSISILPQNYDDALAVVEEIDYIDTGGPSSLKVKAWTKRGQGGIYLDGEELVVHFYANQDCYIKIFHIDVNGQMSLIFPNEFQQNNFIEKEKVYSIPEPSYGFAFELGDPFGTEFIKVIASTSQFKDIEEAFAALGKADAELIERGLTVKQREEKIAEVLFSYTIIEN